MGDPVRAQIVEGLRCCPGAPLLHPSGGVPCPALACPYPVAGHDNAVSEGNRLRVLPGGVGQAPGCLVNDDGIEHDVRVGNDECGRVDERGLLLLLIPQQARLGAGQIVRLRGKGLRGAQNGLESDVERASFGIEEDGSVLILSVEGESPRRLNARSPVGRQEMRVGRVPAVARGRGTCVVCSRRSLQRWGSGAGGPDPSADENDQDNDGEGGHDARQREQCALTRRLLGGRVTLHPGALLARGCVRARMIAIAHE